jgi:hypothetical protein
LDWLEVAKLNSKGQFSIIAALLVAVVLIASVVTTYSTIRYGAVESQPQILSAVDETNLALKQILGFTVGYYGSVLQVTGNSSYAQTLATNYLDSGLENVADIRPEWGASFNVTSLSLGTNWFTNESYSQGNLNITYDLTGLGIYGIAYSTSCRLDVQIAPFSSSNQVCITVVKDENEPVVGLSASSFKFYLYQYSNLTWAMTTPLDEPVSSSNGTYIIDAPPEINPQSFAIQVQDSRGITVAASSFSHYTGKLAFNTTFAETDDYVDSSNSTVDGLSDVGTHSNFAAQQAAPDGSYDTLTEAYTGTQNQDYYPTGYSQLGSTTLVSGGLSNLTAADGVSMKFRSYDSSVYNTIAYDSASSTTLTSQAGSMSWQHTTGTGSDRLLLVSVDVFRSNGGTPSSVTNVTYDGVALTQAATAQYSSNPRILSYLFYLVNPSSGTKTINATFSGNNLAVGGSVTYTNVDQTSPLQVNNVNSGSSASQSVSLTASGTNNKLLFGHMGSYRTTSPSAYTVTEGSGQTNRWAQTGSTFKGRCSEKTVTSGSVSMTWTTSQTASWTAIAAVIQPTRVSTQQTCEVEFSGSSNTNNWNSLLYSINSLSSVAGVSMTFQLYNYQTGQYPTSGDGYMATTLGTTGTLNEQNITVNPTQFRDSLGAWKLKFKAIMSASSSFDISIDLARYRTVSPIYALNMEEQWTNLNFTALHPTLCIKTGSLGSENLAVDVWHAGSWNTVITGLASNAWNNVSVAQYMDSSTFTIRFRGADTVQDNWAIDAALLRPESDQSLFQSLQNPAATVAVELLQNGTMRWLGQNLQNTTQAVPVPPVPVKSIHVNETIDGVNQEVPFQIEDWASSYTVPLGLTSNSTVFGNRQMIVFLVNTHVSDFTLWWNGSDQATQTPLAYTNTYFTGDNPSGHTLTNGILTLSVTDVGKFTVTSTVGSSTSTTSFMRINDQPSTYGAGEAYVIHHGVVRDIIQQEAEWSNGVNNCPNLYANIVLTLPANATYFTYQLNLMFINSTQARTITDLCPINMTSTAGQLQTENGTLDGDPVVASGTQTFSNSTGTWAHHWSQFTDGTNGAGIMFTDQANQMLYTFDTPAIPRGALVANSAAQTISLLPVTLNPVSFQTALDVTWYGAVATFDGSVPPIYSGYGQPGLWILSELPPTITIDIEN